MHDVTFTCMGCDMRLLAEGVDAAGIVAARDLLHAVDARLSRFRAGSELVRLNADPRATVPASALLRAAVAAAVWAAERTDGLVDPTLLDALERQGYTRSLAGAPPAGLAGVVAAAPRRAGLADAVAAGPRRADLGGAVAAAPPRAPAAARSDRRWRAVAVDNAAGTITRPPGLRLDTGGTTKGLAADAAAQLLLGRPAAGGPRRLVVDCGGDLRVAVAPGAAPFDVVVEHPLTGEPAATLAVRGGGVATSGLARRLWRAPDGAPVHHLLDPATGAPAWTGLISATALAATALHAEALAKAALLRGPAGARRLLGRRGGVLVHDDGTVERVGPDAEGRPVLRLRAADLRVAA